MATSSLIVILTPSRQRLI